MLNKTLVGIGALLVGTTLVAEPALARFDLHFASDIPLSNGGTAYEWYMPGLRFNFDPTTRDGVMPTGEPYALFKGNDASPNGHCLEIAMTPGASPPLGIKAMVNDHGTYRTIQIALFGQNPAYTLMRLWVHRNTTFGSLNWSLYLVPTNGDTGFSGDILLDVRRLEVNKAGCTTAQVGGRADPNSNPFPWVSFEGTSNNYTVTKSEFF
jgi:hypothetical protein